MHAEFSDVHAPGRLADPARQSAMIFLFDDRGRVLLHLRDDIRGIAHPGCWAAFGGEVDDGESEEQALRRELREELETEVGSVELLARVLDRQGSGHEVALYRGELTSSLRDLRLSEGAGMALFTPRQLHALPMTPFMKPVLLQHLAVTE